MCACVCKKKKKKNPKYALTFTHIHSQSTENNWHISMALIFQRNVFVELGKGDNSHPKMHMQNEKYRVDERMDERERYKSGVDSEWGKK